MRMQEWEINSKETLLRPISYRGDWSKMMISLNFAAAPPGPCLTADQDG
jgi:hypothetical protein